jgi:hypothetical protein
MPAAICRSSSWPLAQQPILGAGGILPGLAEDGYLPADVTGTLR